MRDFFKVSAVFFLIFGFVGCGEGSSSSDNASGSAELEVQTLNSKLINQKTALEIDFSLTSNYQKGVEVKLTGLDVDVTPCKVIKSTFSKNGKVLDEIVFDDKTSNKRVHAVVQFTKECTPTSYLLKANSLLSLNGKSNNIKFSSAPQTIGAVAGATNTNTGNTNTGNSENANESNVTLPAY